MWFVLFLLVAADAASLGRRPVDIPVEVVYDYPGKSLDVPVARENEQINHEKIVINEKLPVNTEIKEKIKAIEEQAPIIREKKGEQLDNLKSDKLEAELIKKVEEKVQLVNENVAAIKEKILKVEEKLPVIREVEIKAVNTPLIQQVEDIVETGRLPDEIKQVETIKEQILTLEEVPVRDVVDIEDTPVITEEIKQVPLVPVVETENVIIEENIPLFRELVEPAVVVKEDKKEKEVKKETVPKEEPQLRELPKEPVAEKVQKEEPAPKVSLRNHDAKLQLSPEEVVEAQILNIPANPKFQEKVQHEAELNIVHELKQATSDESREESSEESKESSEESKESAEEPDKKKKPEVLLVNDQPKEPQTVVLEEIPDQVVPEVVQQVVQELVQPIVQDVIQETQPEEIVQPLIAVEGPVKEVVQEPVQVFQPVVQEVAQPAVQEIVQPVVPVVPVVQEVVQQVSQVEIANDVPKEREPEIKFEEIQKPSISSDSQVVEQVQEIVQQSVQNQKEEKVVVPEVVQIIEAKPEEKTVEVALDEKVVVPQEVVQQTYQDEPKREQPKEDQPKEEQPKEEQKVEERLPAEQPQKVQKDEVKVDEIKARQIQTEEKPVQADEPQAVQADETKPVQADEAKPDQPAPSQPKPTEGPFGGIFNQIGQIFNRPNQPNKKPEDGASEQSTETWLSGVQNNLNAQLLNFNTSFNEFVNNLRPTEKPATQSDEQPSAPAASPSTPLLDGVQSAFISGFQLFQNNLNGALVNAQNFFQQNPAPAAPGTQSDEASPSNQVQNGFQNAATAFTQTISSTISNFLGQNQNQNQQNDEAGNQPAQNNVGDTILNFFNSQIANVAQVFNRPLSQSDEASQQSTNPLQNLQNAVSNAGQQIQNFLSGNQGTQAQAQPNPIPVQPPALNQKPLEQAQAQGEQIQQGISSLVDNLPKPELPQALPVPPQVQEGLSSLPVPAQVQEGISNLVKPSEKPSESQA